ncbi:hypothetical protein BURK_026625 [Burkholderia sp. SJ98]|nr:hypothetical protein BURK_026625 [Burkholderia sp. SJ98]
MLRIRPQLREEEVHSCLVIGRSWIDVRNAVGQVRRAQSGCKQLALYNAPLYSTIQFALSVSSPIEVRCTHM